VPSPPPPVTFNVSAAFAGVYTNGFSARTVSATRSNGTVVTQTLSLVPAADALFEGTLRKAATLTTLTTAPAGSLVDTRTSYFADSPFMLHGDRGVSSTLYAVTFPRATIPSSATIGQSGPFFSSTTYTDSTKAVVAAVSEATWSVETDGTQSSAYICINLTSTDFTVAERPITRGSVCYRVSTNGSLLGLRTRITFDGEALDLR
jgi:hypothetical protein